jgi:predicted N-acyltransferase
LKLRILFFGTLTAEELYIGISKNENPEAILDAAQEEISKFCKKEGISAFLFYNLNEKDAVLKEYLCRNHFIKLGSLPTTVMEINASSLEGYINGLKKNARKDLRRKLRRSTMQANLVTEIRDDIKGISEEIYKLYMNNFGDSDIHFELLPKRFFEDISENMPGVVKFFITRENAKIVAFNLCLVKRDFCIDKFIGLDPEVAREYHLYFTTLCHNIEWCIKNNIRFYQPGATDYHPKVRLGAKLIPLFIYAKGFNPLLNITVRLIAKLIEPKRLDSSLANIKKI